MNTEMLCIFPQAAASNGWIERFREKGIPYGFVPRDGTAVLHLKRLLDQRYDPLIFHCHFVSYDISAALLKLLFYKRARIIWHLHSRGKVDLRQKGKDLIKMRVLGRCFVDQFIAVGEGVYDHSRARGADSEKLVVIHNGIDATRFDRNNDVRRQVRESLGVSEDHLVYLLLGWDPHTKGVDLFIKAAAHVARSIKPSLFLIIGETPTRQFAMKVPELAHIGPALRIIDPVEDFAAVLNAVDVVVSASRSEGLPYAVLEGMAAGKLILSSDVPGARATYGRSRGVWLFPLEDWRTQAARMEQARALSNTEREAIGTANAKYVADHYSLRRWAEKIGSLYQSLLR
jgi:glycosyltransferase involved in cell wall biosynthesis